MRKMRGKPMRTPMLERPFFVVLRGLTLTVAVVAIPLAALFWKGVPPWLDKLISQDTATAASSEDDAVALPTVSVAGMPAHEMPQVSPRQERSLYSSDAPSSAVPYAPMAYTSPNVPAAPNVNGVASGATNSAAQQTLVAELEQLGAQYYRLEKWGDDGTLYRLSCLVSPPGMSHYQKHFQAIDDDSVKVLQQVIASIRQWHAEMATSEP
ncbi:MAG: hypothetical protein ACRC46_09710 [Thermoguttaceae bacterium]